MHPMRHLVRAGGWLLVVLLAGTTPLGTDDAAHRDLLVHPVLPHAHVVDGHLVRHVQHAARQSQPPLGSRRPGPALGAGSGADEAAAGLAITPPLPTPMAPRGLWGISRRLHDEDLPLPSGLAEAPPHPPPTRAPA